jgi:Protein of unknown function (DUF2934)
MATGKQPRKSTRAKKTISGASETEVPLATGADVASSKASSTTEADGLDALQDQSVDDRIRRRAYELYLARGGSGGSEMEDWLEAERQVRNRAGAEASQQLDATSP